MFRGLSSCPQVFRAESTVVRHSASAREKLYADFAVRNISQYRLESRYM